MAIESPQFERHGVSRPTAADAVAAPSMPPATAAQLIPRASHLRISADAVSTDATSLHRDIYLLHLDERRTAQEQRSVQSLIETLADSGVAWSDMAKMLGVSIPAVRKWRQGEGTTPANRSAVAQLAALIDLLDKQLMIEDPAAWLQIPLAETGSTLADIYAAGRIELIVDYASGWLTADRVLDVFDPEWRSKEAHKEYEAFAAADGQLGIRRIRR